MADALAKPAAEAAVTEEGSLLEKILKEGRLAPTDEERGVLIGHPLGKGHHAFKVGRGDFAQAKATRAAAGVESAPIIDWGDHDCVYFLDPDGNLLELVSYRQVG